MTLQGLVLAFLLVFIPQLGEQRESAGAGAVSGENEEGEREEEKCMKPQWDPKIRFVPDEKFYDINTNVTLTCPNGYWPSATEITCVKPSPRHGLKVPHIIWYMKNSTGFWQLAAEDVRCVGKCQKPQWDPRILFVPDQRSYDLNETVILTCPVGYWLSHTEVSCMKQNPSQGSTASQNIWHVKNGRGRWQPVKSNMICVVPEKPEQLQLDPSTGTLRWKALPSCRGEIIGYQLNFTARRAHDGTFLNFQQVTVNHSVTQYTPPAQSPGSKYTVTVQGLTSAGAGDASSLEFQAYISVVVWFMLSRRRKTVPIKVEEDNYTELQPYENSDIYCEIKGRSLSEEEAEPDLDEYKKNEDVMLSCPEGFQPSYTHVRCSREVQTISRGKPVYREVWLGRASSSSWDRIRSSVECVEVLEVDPGTLEVSSTRIKLNWTCSFPDACQHMQATCRLAGPSSPPCEAEEVTGMEFLYGQMGTFTCPPLQPFTEYTVTISVPPSTVLFSWVIRTKETVPQKPEQLQLDASTGTLSWKALPSCRGEIIGYQVPWAHTQPLPPCSFVQASMQTIESPEDQQSLI
ncbi:hypothetical protein ASZ78_012221 [Callipepla squamata]|uniref:Fibronectin type-III domain-containing protein n=1 Tax=Callipepla squamata TaxID=9009 RepID=A0A226MEI0_CALSU|nr:hypothetical protein ASZ78_012221 [Callipepla squamata]